MKAAGEKSAIAPTVWWRRSPWLPALLGSAGILALLGFVLPGVMGNFSAMAGVVATIGLILVLGLYSWRRLAVQQAQLAEMRARTEVLEQARADLDIFAKAAAHDMREPLRKVEAFGARLEQQMGINPDARAAGYLDRIRNAARRQETLIGALVSHARLERVDDGPELVDLGALVKSVCKSKLEADGALPADVVVRDLPTIEARPGQMHVLFANLVDNALKYAHPERKLAIEVIGNGEEDVSRVPVVIQIRDNGIGFDDRHAERIFEPFARLHSRSEVEGVGLGLTTARKIAETHGGSLRARPQDGEGVVFTLILPRQKANL